MSQFVYLKSEFLSVFDHAKKSEDIALSDPRVSCFYTRLALETAVSVIRGFGSRGRVN